MANTPIGPNVKRLISERASQLSVDKAKERYGVADVGTVAQGIIDGTLQQSLREAATWVKDILQILRKSPGSEQWPTDEDMAEEILRRIKERRGGNV